MSSNPSTLQLIDVNLLSSSVKGLRLPMPPPRSPCASSHAAPQTSSSLSILSAAAISAPLSLSALCRHLRGAVTSVELAHTGNSASRQAVLGAALSELLAAAHPDALRAVSPLFDAETDAALSARVMSVLWARRRALSAELGICALKEWLRLAVLLGEDALHVRVEQLLPRLSPFARRAAEDALCAFPTDAHALCGAVLSAPSPAESETPFAAGDFRAAVCHLLDAADDHFARGARLPPDVTPALRAAHGEWLLQLSVAANAQMETFFLAAALLDRALATLPSARDRLYLLCCAALLLASKQEEIFPVPLRALVRFAGDRFGVDELVAAECQLLALMQYDAVCPTLSAFAAALLAEQETRATERQRAWLHYALATMAVRSVYGQLPLPEVAAAAVHLSRLCFRVPTPTPTAGVQEMIPIITATLRRNGTTGGLYEIFSRPAFHEVSRMRMPQNV